MTYDVVGVSDLRHRIRYVLDIPDDIVGLGLRCRRCDLRRRRSAYDMISTTYDV